MEQKRSAFRWILLIVALGTAVALIALGLINGEFRRVLQKAAAICLECVGIG